MKNHDRQIVRMCRSGDRQSYHSLLSLPDTLHCRQEEYDPVLFFFLFLHIKVIKYDIMVDHSSLCEYYHIIIWWSSHHHKAVKDPTYTNLLGLVILIALYLQIWVSHSCTLSSCLILHSMLTALSPNSNFKRLRNLDWLIQTNQTNLRSRVAFSAQ